MNSYHLEGIVNGVKTSFVVDTGAEVSLMSATVPSLEIRESTVAPVSITNQPITIRGETDVSLSLGALETNWKFLVVDNLNESVLGADFIESHYTKSWESSKSSRRIPFGYQEVKSNLKTMLNKGIIEKSSSEWASPLVLVKKPSEDFRI